MKNGPDDLGALAAEAQTGGIRAAVLGINDGLSTNIALILGVAGASTDPAIVRIAGVASLVAGACSMAVGEFISMRAQVDLLERVMDGVHRRLRSDPGGAGETLRAALVRRGVAAERAKEIERAFAQDSQASAGVYAAMTYGISDGELGSPWIAAFASLLTFAFGAAVPLVPWFFLASATATAASIALGAVAAFVVGAYLGRRNGGRWFLDGLRQIAFIALASGITYGVGRLFRARVG